MMDKFFNPKKIAIVGASDIKGKVGNTLVEKLKKFPGKVHYVNNKYEKLFGEKCWKSLNDIPDKLDLVIIAIPAKNAIDAIKECECRNVIIISAGFGESGNKILEDELYSASAQKKIRIIGPNCFGVVNTKIELDTTFSKLSPIAGEISFVSQSGALWSAIADYSARYKIGFAKFASLGNMCDVDFSDMLEYLDKDKETSVIILYIENLKDGVRFMKTAVSVKKPVIAIKGGRSEAGNKAVGSHTGSLAGVSEIYSSAFKQCGVIGVNNLGEAIDSAQFLVRYGRIGKRILVITNAGGPGILLSDFLEENGLELAKIPDSVIKKINLPSAWSHNNPIDVLGDAREDRFKEVFNKVRNENFYDAVVVVMTPQSMTENITKEILVFGKPVICAFMGFDSFDASELRKNGILCCFDLERAAKVLRNVSRR